MSSDTLNVAQYIAVMILDTADLAHDKSGLHRSIAAVRSLPEDRFSISVDPEQVDEAIRILSRARLAHISEDPFAGRFLSIEHKAIRLFLSRLDRERDQYSEIADKHGDISRAENQTYPTWDMARKYPALESYGRMGHAWLTEVIEKFRSHDIQDAAEVGLPISSSAWTGLNEKMTSAKRAEVSSKIDELIASVDQSELDERTKENVRGRLEAAKRLMDTPDPPWRTILELLNHNALTGFLNFTALMTIFFGNF